MVRKVKKRSKTLIDTIQDQLLAELQRLNAAIETQSMLFAQLLEVLTDIRLITAKLAGFKVVK